MDQVQTYCQQHPAQRAEAPCQRCRYGYCSNCLVYPRGDTKPPLCLPCALSMSGIRSAGGGAPRRSWWTRFKERRAAAPAEPQTGVVTAGVSRGAEAVAGSDPTGGPEGEDAFGEGIFIPGEDKSWAELDSAKWTVTSSPSSSPPFEGS